MMGKLKFLLLAAGASVVGISAGTAPAIASSGFSGHGTLVTQVREAAWKYRNLQTAIADGYGPDPATGCVSDDSHGAMGVHFVKGSLFDGELDPAQPEALVYEPQRNGSMRLVAAEYITFVDAWHVNHDQTPVLSGQQLFYEGSPNRYGLPPVYELHVWAFKENPNGMFASWNPDVSCADYIAPTT